MQQAKLLVFIEAMTFYLKDFKPDCCILATRIATNVLKKLHVRDVRPLSVTANILNAKYVEKGQMPQSHEEAQKWKEEGCWQIILGSRRDYQEDKWPGHLVVLIGEQLVDLTLFQCNRPEKQIFLTPLIAEATEEFLSGKKSLNVPMNGCEIFYDAFIQDKSFVHAPDWQRNYPEIERKILNWLRKY